MVLHVVWGGVCGGAVEWGFFGVVWWCCRVGFLWCGVVVLWSGVVVLVG